MAVHVWNVSATFPASVRDIYSLSTFGAKVYAGVHNVGVTDWTAVYESSDGINWALNKSFDDVFKSADDEIISLCVYGGKLYALRNWAGQARLYEYNGAVWSLTRDLYTVYSLTYPQCMFTDGVKLYCGGAGPLQKNLWSSSAPAGVWASELTTVKLSGVHTGGFFGADIFIAGAYQNFADGAAIYRKTGGAWDGGTFYANTSLFRDSCVFDGKFYVIGDNIGDATKHAIPVWDGGAWAITNLLKGGPIAGIYTIFATPDGRLQTNAPDSAPGTTYNFYNSPDGVDFSTVEAYGSVALTSPAPHPRSHCDFDGRVLVGAGLGHAGVVGAVYYTQKLVNAHKIDDASLRDGAWNSQKFSFSALMKAEAADEPYVRLGVAPGSGTDADREVRKARSYFMAPKSGGWTQVHGCVDSTAAERGAKEDLANFYPEVFKHGQRVRLQAPCVISGTRVPIAYVDPLTPKAADLVTYANVAFMNNFVMKLRWNPIHTAQVLDSDVDLFTVGTATNYIRVVQRGSTFGGLGQEREYFPGARYGRHDPTFVIRKVVAGVTVLSHNLTLYPSYPGENEAADVFGNDTWEFEVVHVQNTIYGIRIKSAGLVGEWWAGSTGLGAFASNPIGDVTISGYGYFGAPEIRGQLDDEFTNRLGPARKLPATRADVVRRMGFAKHINPIFVGDRDPTEGVLTLDNPFLFTETFTRADSGSLGGKWSTLTRTGAGWYISGSTALCSGTGMEIWTPAPRHTDYQVVARVGLSTTGNYVGVIVRHETSETSLMGYSVELEQTGVGAANMNVCRWFKGVREILSTTALSSYTAGNEYMLALTATGTNLVAYVMDYPLIVVVATDTLTDSFFTKPGVAGLYGVSGGPAEIITADAFALFRDFDYSID